MGTLGTNKNFKIGDEVEILPLTRHEKDEYPVGWDWKMDTYIGSTGTIEHITPNGYKLKDVVDIAGVIQTYEAPFCMNHIRKDDKNVSRR